MNKQGDGIEQIATSAHLKPGRGGKRSQIKSYLLGAGKKQEEALSKHPERMRHPREFSNEKVRRGRTGEWWRFFKHSFCSIFFAPDHIINPPAGLFLNIIDCLRRMHPSQPTPCHHWRASCGLAPSERVPH